MRSMYCERKLILNLIESLLWDEYFPGSKLLLSNEMAYIQTGIEMTDIYVCIGINKFFYGQSSFVG